MLTKNMDEQNQIEIVPQDAAQIKKNMSLE